MLSAQGNWHIPKYRAYLLSQRGSIKVRLAASIEHAEQGVDISNLGGLIQGNGDGGVIQLAQVHVLLQGLLHHLVCIAHVDLDGVKEGVLSCLVTQLAGTYVRTEQQSVGEQRLPVPLTQCADCRKAKTM